MVDKQEAVKVLPFIFAALRLKGLDVALVLEPSSKSYSNLDLERESARKEHVQYLCGLFIIEFEGKLYFIHKTTRDFLIKSNLTLKTLKRIHGDSR